VSGTAEPDDVADILIDLARRETKTFSVQFARSVAGEIATWSAAQVRTRLCLLL